MSRLAPINALQWARGNRVKVTSAASVASATLTRLSTSARSRGGASCPSLDASDILTYAPPVLGSGVVSLSRFRWVIASAGTVNLTAPIAAKPMIRPEWHEWLPDLMHVIACVVAVSLYVTLRRLTTRGDRARRDGTFLSYEQRRIGKTWA